DRFDLLSRQVTGQFPSQHPQLEGVIDQKLLGGRVEPAPIVPIVQSVDPAGKTVTLSIGRLHGATKGSQYDLFPVGADLKDPHQRIAGAEVEDVALGTCTARLRPVDRRKVDLARLAGARAVETSVRCEEHTLRVY